MDATMEIREEQTEATAFTESLKRLRAMKTPDNVPTGVIVMPDFFDVARFKVHDGSGSADPLAQRHWCHFHNGMTDGLVEADGIPSLAEVKARARNITADGQVPIAIMNMAYNTLTDGFIKRILLHAKDGTALEIPKNAADVLETHHLFAASALLDDVGDFATVFEPTYYGLAVKFRLDRRVWVTNLFEEPSSIEVDCDDGDGFRPVAVDSVIEISYASDGDKIVRVRCQLGGTARETAFLFRVREDAARYGWTEWKTIEADEPYEDGKTYSGRASIKSPTGKPPFTKPVVMATGFGGVYDLAPDFCLRAQLDLADALVAQGYQVIRLDFRLNGGYVQGNALCLMKCIEEVQANLDGDEKLVIGGSSMGGLVVRYALGYMEKHGKDHRAKVFFSYDSPQNGAFIPLGDQMFSLYMESYDGDRPTKADQLRSPAAKQLLMYHVGDRYDVTGEYPLVREERKELMRELAELGYPHVRKIAVSNGRGDGQGLDIPARDVTVEWWKHFYANPWIKIWSMPDRNPEFIEYMFARWGALDRSYCVKGAIAFDGAPSGTSPHNGEVADKLANYGVGRVHERHHDTNCYIPAISAFDLATSDPYYDISSGTASSPFDAYTWSKANDGHGSQPDYLVKWLVGQIMETE